MDISRCGLIDWNDSALLALEFCRSEDVATWCASMLEFVGGLVVESALSDAWKTTPDTQVMREDFVITRHLLLLLVVTFRHDCRFVGLVE